MTVDVVILVAAALIVVLGCAGLALVAMRLFVNTVASLYPAKPSPLSASELDEYEELS